MLQALKDYIKLAVDVEREILAGGGGAHADCESALLANGSKQENVWGADWNPETEEVSFESLINIRPKQNNRGMIIQDPVLREKVSRIVLRIFKGEQ
ncbi:MAG: hypothetical protein HZB51_32510 [Chloroflexi bacterium]|nr:hypothetical protein [Chloroflexota bacterium]